QGGGLLRRRSYVLRYGQRAAAADFRKANDRLKPDVSACRLWHAATDRVMTAERTLLERKRVGAWLRRPGSGMTRTGHQRHRRVDCNYRLCEPLRQITNAGATSAIVGAGAARTHTRDAHGDNKSPRFGSLCGSPPCPLPGGSVRPRLDWAAATLALPISAVANTTTPKIFLIVGSSGSLVPPPEAELAGPAPEATPRACGRSFDRSVPTSELSWVRRGP